MQAVALQDLIAAPWKNGGGVTRELATHPPGRDMQDFLWRISIADVHRSGPFSHFAGIDRTITLLEGDGFQLAFADGRLHDLASPGAPFTFSGDDAVDAQLIGGPSMDLNVMLRRHAVRGRVDAWRTPAMLPTKHLVALVCMSGEWELHADDVSNTILPARTAALMPFPHAALRVRPLQPDGVLLSVHVQNIDEEDRHAS